MGEVGAIQLPVGSLKAPRSYPRRSQARLDRRNLRGGGGSRYVSG